MNHIFTLLLLLLFFSASAQKNKTITQMNREADSLEKASGDTRLDPKFVKNFYPFLKPHVFVENADSTNSISLYTPFGLIIQLRHIRPDFNPENYLCVPGAYTSVNTQIDGLYIEDGIEINETINNKLTGACILSNDSIQFLGLDEINSQLISQVKSTKKSMFQQSLLVKNNQIVPCNLFYDKKNLRRALIQFKDNYFLIGESQSRVTISDFQESLVKIGAINAINLDMGTWSEGWYKNQNGEKITVGEKMYSTNKQTNWIIYTRQ
jgi:hypothetical protein